MGMKKGIVKDAPVEIADEYPIEEATNYIESPKEIKTAEPAEQNGGFSVYIGSSIRGVIQCGTIFGCTRDNAIHGVESSAVEKYPLIAELIVSGETLAQDRIKVKTSGNLLHKYYTDLKGR